MTATIQTHDYSVDLLKVILWQYEEALRLRGLVQQKQDWYETEQAQFWEDCYSGVFNLKTCNYFGLVVWSIILGQPIIFPNAAAPTRPTWAFGAFHRNFTRGNFATDGGFTYALSPETARAVLRLRYYQLTGTCTVPAINRMLADVFANYGHAYVQDNLNMTQNYVFNFYLPGDFIWVLKHFDILPRPAGVKGTFSFDVPAPWGFGIYRGTFDHSNFAG